MGLLGGAVGGFLGGEYAGAVSDVFHGSCRGLKGKKHHKCRKRKQKSRETAKGIGSAAGGVAGGALEPFKHGGRVKGKKGAPRKAIVHGGEYVLPVGVKPTAAQKKAVAQRKKGKGGPKISRPPQRRPKKKN